MKCYEKIVENEKSVIIIYTSMKTIGLISRKFYGFPKYIQF